MFVTYRFQLIVRFLSRLILKSALIAYPAAPNEAIKLSRARSLMLVIYRFYW